MKTKKAHVVPLSKAALAVLERMLKRRSNASAYIFPGRDRGRPLSHPSLYRLVDAAPHHDARFAGAFRDWAGDTTNHERDVAEAALAHKVRGVEAPIGG